nr:MAG TPA: hypothetical protein [Caudoviricetes sp.]
MGIDEIRQIVKILADDDTPVSVDEKNNSIIFWFEDKTDKTKMNKVAVNINHKLKKFGTTNYMVTAGKVDVIEFKKAKIINK